VSCGSARCVPMCCCGGLVMSTALGSIPQQAQAHCLRVSPAMRVVYEERCCLHNWLMMCAHFYMQLGSFSTTAADVAFSATRDASAIAWLTGRSEVRAVPAARITDVTSFTATAESLCAHPHTLRSASSPVPEPSTRNAGVCCAAAAWRHPGWPSSIYQASQVRILVLDYHHRLWTKHPYWTQPENCSF
jgi:hypothetical protein